MKVLIASFFALTLSCASRAQERTFEASRLIMIVGEMAHFMGAQFPEIDVVPIPQLVTNGPVFTLPHTTAKTVIRIGASITANLYTGASGDDHADWFRALAAYFWSLGPTGNPLPDYETSWTSGSGVGQLARTYCGSMNANECAQAHETKVRLLMAMFPPPEPKKTAAVERPQ